MEGAAPCRRRPPHRPRRLRRGRAYHRPGRRLAGARGLCLHPRRGHASPGLCAIARLLQGRRIDRRSVEHTSELQSLMRISYAVFCWKKKISEDDNNYIELLLRHEYVTIEMTNTYN